MKKHISSCCTFLLAIAFALLAGGSIPARSLPADYAQRPASFSSRTATPAHCAANHNVGRLGLAITNYGVLGGQGFIIGQGIDCFTGSPLLSAEYPKGSGVAYLFAGAVWVGAVVGPDTLVSVGADGWQFYRDMNPDEPPAGNLIYRSTVSSDSVVRSDAVSEMDYVAVYTDTFTSGVTGLGNDIIDGRPHIPLSVEITQQSYSWSLPSAEDFVMFDCTIRNIGSDTLHDGYTGLFVDGDVGLTSDYIRAQDDVCGFTKLATLGGICVPPVDSIPVAWIIDNDGDLTGLTPCPGITGLALLRVPAGASNISFNWWVSNTNSALDYGPYLLANSRDFQTGSQGTPEGDRNKYFLMRNGERDPNQVYTGILHQIDTAWGIPAQPWIANELADGWDTKYLLSFGPFTLPPGEEAPFTFAYVAGEAVHHVSNNVANLPANPDTYMANLDFSDFFLNVRLASELFDNPFVDTDGDGNYGQTIVCWGNEMWVTGDGVPDFRPRGTGPNCCLGTRGNINGSLDDLVDLTDLSYLVAYLTGHFGSVALACQDEANIDGSGIIDITDVALLISHLTSDPGSVPLPACP